MMGCRGRGLKLDSRRAWLFNSGETKPHRSFPEVLLILFFLLSIRVQTLESSRPHFRVEPLLSPTCLVPEQLPIAGVMLRRSSVGVPVLALTLFLPLPQPACDLLSWR